MNLEEITDKQATTRKMRKALRIGKNAGDAVRELSKKKNPNRSTASVEPMDGPSDMSDQLDPQSAFVDV